MNPFENVPDELLYEMCEGWTNSELINMSESYSRVYQVCHNIIDERKEKFIDIKNLKSCLKKAVRDMPNINEEPLFGMEKSTNKELRHLVMSLYPSFYTENEQIEKQHGEYFQTNFDENTFINIYNRQIVPKWFDQIINLLQTKEALFELALITQQWVDEQEWENNGGPGFNYRNLEDCVPPEIVEKFEPVETPRDFWFSTEQKNYHNLSPEEQLQHDLTIIINKMREEGHTNEDIFGIFLKAFPNLGYVLMKKSQTP